MHETLFQILALLDREPADGLSILERFEERAPAEAPSLPALYRHLRRALEEGWLVVSGTEDTGPGAGRPRKIYALTPQGGEAVRARARQLRTFADLVLEGEAGP